LSSALWYRVALSAEQVAAGHVDVIQRLFAEAIQDLPSTEGACLFATSHDTRTDRLRENVDDHVALDVDAVFFSPASIAAVPHLIAQYQAEPSPPPERARAALLVGDPRDWDLLPRSTH
jgi:hypothetical protein